MTVSRAVHGELSRIGGTADEHIDLAEAALLLAAAGRPRLRRDPYRRHLDTVAADVTRLAGSGRADLDLEERARMLARVIAQRYGYTCPEEIFGDAESADLARVIDRRAGLPVAVGLIYMHAAAAQAWTVAGIDFPTHFLIRFEVEGRRMILDPATGRSLAASDLRSLLKAARGLDAELVPEHYAPMPKRAVLVRLQNNVSARLLAAGRIDDALAAVEAALLVAPGDPQLWREAGLLNAKLDNIKAAVSALENFLHLSPDAPQGRSTEALLRDLRARLN